MKPNIYVLHTDKWKLKTMEFSTLELALDYIKTLDHKEYEVITGWKCSESMKSM